MKLIKLTQPLLIGDSHRDAGEPFEIHDARADELIRGGYATLHEGPCLTPDASPPDGDSLARTAEMLSLHGIEPSEAAKEARQAKSEAILEGE